MTASQHGGYDELAQAAETALKEFGQVAQRLAREETEGRTRDCRVLVRVTAAGEVTQVRLSEDAVRRYGPAKLGEVVARTLRSTGQRARSAYERRVAELVPPEVAECERVLRDALRQGGAE